jgi:polyvinyl alcohol dehydrogenase (cytochrome)
MTAQMNDIHWERVRSSRRLFAPARRRRISAIAAAAAALTGALTTGGMAQAAGPTPSGSAPGGSAGSQWATAGHDLNDSHYQAAGVQISPANVHTLAPKWTLSTNGNVTGTPTVYGGMVYASDLSSTLWAVDAGSGHVVWSHSITDYTGVAGDESRVSPAVYGDELITGDGELLGPSTGGARVFAVSRLTGKLMWITKVDSFVGSVITSSPVVYRGVAYLGISSQEEALATTPGYQCCVFRGAVVALNARTGRLLWKTYMVPSNNGNSDTNRLGYYSGNPVWGSTPVVDPLRGLVYVGTGNTYTVPPGICTMPGQTGCTQPPADDYVDSILALNLRTGAITWADHTLTSDNFTLTCTEPGVTCGPDYDIGTGPNLFTTTNPATGRPAQLLGIGQKNGVYSAVDPASGKVAWTTQVGPGGTTSATLGGIEWGSATDGRRIYVAEADSGHVSYTLGGSGPYAGQTATGGSWAALDPATGKILWQTPDPQTAVDIGFVSGANGVVYAGSNAGTGDNMYALDAATGQILWRFASGGAVISGAAIVGDSVYWGSGYYFATCPSGVTCGSNNKLYAFTVR